MSSVDFLPPQLATKSPPPPPSYSSTRGSQEAVAEGEKGSLCYVQAHSRLMLCHKIARLNPRYGDKKCLSSFSLPPRVFPRFPFAVIFSSAFFRFFPLWVCLTFAQRRREEGGEGDGDEARLKSERRINCAYRRRQLTQLMAQCVAQGRWQQ